MGVCILILVIGCANAKVLKRCILPAPDGGVEKQNSITTTSDFTGAFNQAKTREEFMNLIQHGRV